MIVPKGPEEGKGPIPELSGEPPKQLPTKSFIETFGRFGTNADFEYEIGRRVRRKISDEQKGRIEGELKRHGIRLDAESCPQYLEDYMGRFSEDDWLWIKNSKTPLLRLYAVNNHYSLLSHSPHNVSAEDFALSATQPLIHTTTLDGLRGIISTGHIQTDRERYEEARKVDPLSADSMQTHTFGLDREVGLDNYVFAHYARVPSNASDDKYFGKVQVLIHPHAIMADGAFATLSDIADIDMWRTVKDLVAKRQGGKIDEDENRVLGQYLNEVTSGEYFFEEVVRSCKVYSSGQDFMYEFLTGRLEQKNNLGGVFFSTWEVKIPTVKTDDIMGIVFSDPQDLETFRREYTGNIPLMLEMKDMLGDLRKQIMADRLDRDFEDRHNRLAAKPPGDIAEYYISIPQRSPYYDIVSPKSNICEVSGLYYPASREAILDLVERMRKYDMMSNLTAQKPQKVIGFKAPKDAIQRREWPDAFSNLYKHNEIISIEEV
ncbi:MAG: hypothetical protein V1744_03155 [Candidatus Altiarchaeota archaeon]